MNSQNDVFSLNKYNDALLAGNITADNNMFTAAYGWLGGGVGSTVQLLTYATDTSTASIRGPLSAASEDLGGTGNNINGWFFSGTINGTSPITNVSRITYATDTNTALARGGATVGVFLTTGAGNLTAGWFYGGDLTNGGTYTSAIQRITYATDTAVSSLRAQANFINGVSAAAGAGNATAGWFAAGYAQTGLTSVINRVTYATDTVSPSARGNASFSQEGGTGVGNATNGWFAGGNNGATLSSVQGIVYATDTAAATVRGNLAIGSNEPCASGNSTNGWISGGSTSNHQLITYATDTTTATVRGVLAISAGGQAGVN